MFLGAALLAQLLLYSRALCGSTLSRSMVTAAIGDADSSVRATARRAYWVLRRRFPDFAEAVMNSLAPSMQVSVHV